MHKRVELTLPLSTDSAVGFTLAVAAFALLRLGGGAEVAPSINFREGFRIRRAGSSCSSPVSPAEAMTVKEVEILRCEDW